MNVLGKLVREPNRNVINVGGRSRMLASTMIYSCLCLKESQQENLGENQLESV